jgi:phosphomannomutase
MIDDVARDLSATVVRTPVGEANVVAAMRERKADFGGEGNGGVIWPEVVHVRDSLGAMALTLALMAREDRALSEIVAALPSYAIVKRKTPIREGLAEKAYAKLRDRFASARFDEQDGLRIDVDDPPSWVHVRPSNTEPILRVIAEAPTRDAAERLAGEAETVVASL